MMKENQSLHQFHNRDLYLKHLFIAGANLARAVRREGFGAQKAEGRAGAEDANGS